MNASLTQTYAKAVRDLAEAAQMIRGTAMTRGTATAESKEARRAAEERR